MLPVTQDFTSSFARGSRRTGSACAITLKPFVWIQSNAGARGSPGVSMVPLCDTFRPRLARETTYDLQHRRGLDTVTCLRLFSLQVLDSCDGVL